MQHDAFVTLLALERLSLSTEREAKGFTLIELIIVIVILGILAVTAAPQFFNFGSDARTATLKGLEGSIVTGSDMVFARATIASVERVENEEIELNDVMVPLRFGYPNFVLSAGAPDEAAIISQVQAVFNIDQNDWDYAGNPVNASFRISPRGVNNNVDIANMNSIINCYVEYSAPTSAGSSPNIISFATGC